MIVFEKPKESDFTGKVVLITDNQIDLLYKEIFPSFEKILVAPGEISKTREEKARIEDLLLEKKIGKDGHIVALGGGSLLDLAGFVAATYMRGIRLSFIPTTLLAMVDAAIGGKVAVNTCFAKNSIGTFYNPEKIFIHTPFLNTLPEKEIRSGKAEMLKHGLIKDATYFHEVLSLKISNKLILRSIEIKQQVVKEDPFDKDSRRILNFGHTLGHALEMRSNYKISHGEAVLIGMHFASYLSFKRGLLSQNDFLTIEKALKHKKFGPFSFDSLFPFIALDKKGLSFVLLEGIGKVSSSKEIIDYAFLKQCYQELYDA